MVDFPLKNMYHLCSHYLYSINAECLVYFEGTGSLQGRGEDSVYESWYTYSSCYVLH